MDPEIICLEGNGYRPSHKGDGYKASGIMYTLNIVEVHCVCYRVADNDERHDNIFGKAVLRMA